jgi:hypothetical protein
MTLLEAFDNPLSYKRNRDEERYLSSMFQNLGIGYFEVYDAVLGSDTIRFYLLLIRGKHYELHFSNSANDHEIGDLNQYRGNQLTRVIATGLELAIKKLKEKNAPFLIYGNTERRTNLYKKAIKSKHPGVIIKDVKNISGADGTMYPYGFYVKTDTRSLKIENVIKRASLK